MANKSPNLASRATCTGCMACVDACNVDAIHGVIASDGHLHPQCDTNKCIACGRCSRVCPIISGFDYQSAINTSQPYAGWAKDDDLRMRSSSGGVFAALAMQILTEGGCVAGAIMDGCQVRHIIIDSIKDLHLLQGTKYQQGNLSGIYKAVSQRLHNGQKVLFSGTGCQVGGLYSYLGAKDYKESLYTTDLICSGFTSLLPLQCFLDHEPYSVQTLSFRDKINGWVQGGKTLNSTLRILTKDQQVISYPRNIIYGAFQSKLAIRNSCLDCKFTKPHRKADLTLADFWGDIDYPQEHYKGVSLIISHSDKGSQLLQQSEITYHKTSWEKFIFHNYRYLFGNAKIIKMHFMHWIYPYTLMHCSYSLNKRLLCGSPTSFLWIPYRGILYILSQIHKIQRNHYISKWLKR